MKIIDKVMTTTPAISAAAAGTMSMMMMLTMMMMMMMMKMMMMILGNDTGVSFYGQYYHETKRRSFLIGFVTDAFAKYTVQMSSVWFEKSAKM